MTVSLSPIFNGYQGLNDAGIPLMGGQLYTYQAGTSTPAATYTTASGAVANANPIVFNAAGRPPFEIWLTDGSAYRFVLLDFLGNQIGTYDDITGIGASALEARLASAATVSGGASLVGYNPALAYASGLGQFLNYTFARTAGEISAGITPTNYAYPPYNVKRYGALGDNSHNDTAAIQAAIDSCYAAGGGTVYIPAGTYKVTTITKSFAAAVTVNIAGAGKRATVIQQIAATAGTVFSISSTVLILDIYCTFSDFSVMGIGNGASDNNGVDATNIASCTFERMYFGNCNTGFENLGSLVLDFRSCDFVSNRRGYRSAKANGIYANLVRFFGGSFALNTVRGIDLTHTNSHSFFGTRFEVNGTTLNTTTGAVRTQATINEEASISNLLFAGCYFEGNLGDNFTGTSPSSGSVFLTIQDTPIIASEAGKALNIGGFKSTILSNVVALTPGDTALIASNHLETSGCIIGTLTYSGSGVPTHIGLEQTAGTTQFSSWRAGSATYNPPSLADGAGVTTTVTVTGAALGDFATATFSLDLQGITLTAWVSAADTVSVRFQNESGGVLDLASGTLSVRASKS